MLALLFYFYCQNCICSGLPCSLWLPFQVQRLKFLKRYTELYVDFMITPYMNCFYELGHDHFFGFKGAVVVHLGPTYQLVIFPQNLVGTLQCFFKLFRSALDSLRQLFHLLRRFVCKTIYLTKRTAIPFAFGMAVLFLFISLTAPDRTSNQALLSVLSIFHEWHLFGHSHDCWSPPAQPDNTTFRADYRAM